MSSKSPPRHYSPNLLRSDKVNNLSPNFFDTPKLNQKVANIYSTKLKPMPDNFNDLANGALQKEILSSSRNTSQINSLTDRNLISDEMSKINSLINEVQVMRTELQQENMLQLKNNNQSPERFNHKSPQRIIHANNNKNSTSKILKNSESSGSLRYNTSINSIKLNDSNLQIIKKK